MDNSNIDSNIKLILDLRNNKGVFPVSLESAIIAHSPNGEMTYLDSVLDYLYQQVSNKIRLYTEKDGNNTKGKAYPAAMGLRNANNITSLLTTINNYASLLNALQLQINNIDYGETIEPLNNIIRLLQEDFNNLMQASEYSYLEIKFSDSPTRPTSNLDDQTYWRDKPISESDHLWLGIRAVTVRRGENGEAIITKGSASVVSLLGPKGEKGDPGERGPAGVPGSTGQNGDSYRPALMYKWTDSRTITPATPTDPLNLGWSENPGNPVGDNRYLWMTQNYRKMSDNTYLNHNWSTPVCLSGEDGVGSDGAGIEFIFYRTNDNTFTPSVSDMNAYFDGNSSLQELFLTNNFPFIGPNEANILSGNNWTDNPSGIQQNAKYEWASFRESSNGTWSYFCAPFRWSVWGEDGVDGDGIEYIYYRCNEANKWGKYPVYGDLTDPRNWASDSNYQNPEYFREDTGWTDEPQGVNTNNVYEYVSSRKTLPVYGNPNKKEWGSYSQPVVWAKFGKDGQAADLGLNGAVVRFRGEYTSNTLYVNESLDISKSTTSIRYIDVVMVTTLNGTSYYMVKPEDGTTRTTTVSPTASGQNDWQEATGFSFIAAEALYAHDAHIDDLSTYEFVVQNSANNIVAGMTGATVLNSVVDTNDDNVRIWAGSNAANELNLNSDDIPFKVFLNGKLKATNAEIKGDLSIDSLLLTSKSSLNSDKPTSYYYDKDVVLPNIITNEHRVIFIITESATHTATVKLNSGDLIKVKNSNSQYAGVSQVTLDPNTIYLAISISDVGGNNFWLMQSLNSIVVTSQIINQIVPHLLYSNNSTSDIDVYDPKTVKVSSLDANGIDNDKVVLQLISGKSSSFPSTSEFGLIVTNSTGAWAVINVSGVGTLTYEDGSIETIASNVLVNGTCTIRGSRPINLSQNYKILDFNWYDNPLTELVKEGDYDPFDVANFVKLTLQILSYDIYYYTSEQIEVSNVSNPVTTSTVGSNGFVIDKGIIVATDMTEGATVNTTDCIVYKDVTTDPNNEEYTVTNYGNSSITIGNTILSSGNSILVKAIPNTHIDFSDITAIDAGDIYDIDPAPMGDPVNH